jgi:endonuclease YncB( thermonuclease family)
MPGASSASRSWYEGVSWRSYAAIKDLETARELSESVGEYPVVRRSFSHKLSGLFRRDRSVTYSEAGRRVSRPEEIMHDLREDAQIIIPKHGRPALCGRSPFFRRAEFIVRVAANRFAKTGTTLPCFALALLISSAAMAADITGPARVVDGDTIRIGDTRIRLWGIDAVERDQTCQGKDGETYECGRDLAAVLAELTRGRKVRCQEVACSSSHRKTYGRSCGVCRTEAGELNAAMVARGWAVDDAIYSRGRYQAEQQQARRAGLGIWAGRFEMPWLWRKHEKMEATGHH